MTKLTRYQLAYLSRNTQFVLFDIKGKLLESCDSLFSTKSLDNKAVFEWFPFLEAISEVLKTTEPGQEVLFQKIQKPWTKLPGTYDFRIIRQLPPKQNMLLLIITDYTQMYRKYQELQQQFNELYIEKQGLESSKTTSI